MTYDNKIKHFFFAKWITPKHHYCLHIPYELPALLFIIRNMYTSSIYSTSLLIIIRGRLHHIDLCKNHVIGQNILSLLSMESLATAKNALS